MPNSFDLNSNQVNVVSSAINLAANVANQAIVTPTGGNALTIGINGFVFDFLGEEELPFESEITDHYVEDNYAIQDHIAQKPIRYIAKGYIGELYNIFPNSILSILTTVQTLSAITDFQPVFTAQANQVYNTLATLGDQAVNVVGQAQSLFSLIGGVSTGANRQQMAYTTLLNFWQNRISCTIQTPWTVMFDMYIEKVIPMQPETTPIITEFSVTFKQLRFSSTTVTTPLTISNPAGTGVKVSNTAPLNLPSNFTLV